MADHPVPPPLIPSTVDITLIAKQYYAETLYNNVNAGASRRPLDDLREAVTTLEEIEPIGRRVFGGAHPFVIDIDHALEQSRAVAAVHEAATNGDISAIQAGLDALKVANRKI